jgi:uncharacterized membrane protein YfcA
MKKLFLFMVLAVALSTVAVKSKAQIALVSPTYGNTNDTVTNTASKVLWKQVNGYKETVTIAVNVTSISGTLGGTIVPIASNDGTNFYDISTATKDTFTVANTTSQGKAYYLQRGYKYYGVKWTGTGTMSGSFTGTLLARKTTE